MSRTTTPEIVTRTESAALAEENAAVRAAAERAALLVREQGMDLPLAEGRPLLGAELDAWCDRKEGAADKNEAEIGIGYAIKKRELPHGAFGPWLAARGVNPSTAQKRMKVAEFLLSMDPANAPRGAHLPQRTLKVLAYAPPQIVADLFAEGVLDEAPTAEEVAEIVKLRKEVARLGSLVEDARARSAPAPTRPVSPWPEPVARIRAESAAQAEAARLALDDLAALARECCAGFELADMDDDARYVAARTVYAHLRGARTIIDRALARLGESFEVAALGDPEALPLYSDAEARQIAIIRDTLVGEQEIEAEVRRLRRAAARSAGPEPRPRGRPRKVQ